MKNILRIGMLVFAFGMIFVSVDTANAQNRQKQREARREYRDDVRDARKDYRRRANNGDYRKANREYREDVRDARREYRGNGGRRMNRGYYQQRPRVYYRNGRRYVINY